MEKLIWPRTNTGTIDWEVVFENPDTGLLLFISKAHSAHAIRDTALAIIQQLYTRKKDKQLIHRFTAELHNLIPDDSINDDLPHLVSEVSALLRKIKDERIKKSAEHDQHKKYIKGDNKRDVARRVLKKKVKKEQKKKKKALQIYYRLAGVVITFAILGSIVFSAVTEEDDKSPLQILIEQMNEAVEGKAVKTHIYKGKLLTEEMYGRIAVTAYGIPSSACNSAAWYFVNRGNVIINDQMPKKISPIILKEHCAVNIAGAKLTWISKNAAK